MAEFKLTTLEQISKERDRQINEEGWTPEHDDEHIWGSMALAAACYAAPIQLYKEEKRDFANKAKMFIDPWPWEPRWDKRRKLAKGNSPIDPQKLETEDRIDLLIKAGALIVAEIDRLKRAQLKPHSSNLTPQS